MPNPSGLTPYTELADVIASLPLLLREARRARGLSQRAAAKELNCSFATVSRIEAGDDCVLSNAVAVLRWLDRQVTAVGSAPGEVL
jgi:ribosome-binding protein aMBF1 (putative translation factor)